jgi:hypothetical protein
MTLQQRLSALIASMKSETKAIRSFVTGSDSGDATGLNTAATNLVAAINEVRATAESAGGSSVNDASNNTTDAWSGSKVASSIATAISNALEGQDLSDVADAIAAAAAERADLATAASVATLTTTVGNKANTADIYTQAQLGNPDTDLVALWNAA